MSSPDPYTFRAANALPQGTPEDLTTMTVEQIARARGVTKRYAYTLMRRAQQKKMDEPIPTNQRDLILSLLYRHPEIRNTNDLSDAVHDAGSKLPPHDVTKTLWSLQKSRYVRFRERANGVLFALKLTPDGKTAALKVLHPAIKPKYETPEEVAAIEAEADAWANEPVPEDKAPGWLADEHAEEIEEIAADAGQAYAEAIMGIDAEVVTNVGPDQQEQARDIAVEHAVEVASRAAAAQETIIALGAGEPVKKPWDSSFSGWPQFLDIRNRARKALKLAAAAKLLEEVGEDEMALSVIEKNTFTDLEDEVIDILRFFKEID